MFKVYFNGNETDYVMFPITALMRQVKNFGEDRCRLLVTYLNDENPTSNSFILGTAFFQNFFSVFEYKDRIGLNNTVALRRALWSLPGARIGNETFEEGTSPFTAYEPPNPDNYPAVTPDNPFPDPYWD